MWEPKHWRFFSLEGGQKRNQISEIASGHDGQRRNWNSPDFSVISSRFSSGKAENIPFMCGWLALSSWFDMSAQHPLSESFSVLAGLCISKLTCKREANNFQILVSHEAVLCQPLYVNVVALDEATSRTCRHLQDALPAHNQLRNFQFLISRIWTRRHAENVKHTHTQGKISLKEQYHHFNS